MENTIYILSKSVYGRNLAYPNCHLSRTFCDMCGTETLTPHMLESIVKLGFFIVEHGAADSLVPAGGVPA